MNDGRPLDPERVEGARAHAIPFSEAHELAALLPVLADPLRARLITGSLATEETCVGDRALALDVEGSTSCALRLLRTAGLVQRRSEVARATIGSATAGSGTSSSPRSKSSEPWLLGNPNASGTTDRRMAATRSSTPWIEGRFVERRTEPS